MAEARAAVNSLRVGSVHLEQIATKAKLRGIQVIYLLVVLCFLGKNATSSLLPCVRYPASAEEDI
jgi:hypothetical protein